MGEAGFEPIAKTPQNSQVRDWADAKSDVLEPDLAALVAVWPTLPEAVRAAILAMARAAGGKPLVNRQHSFDFPAFSRASVDA